MSRGGWDGEARQGSEKDSARALWPEHRVKAGVVLTFLAHVKEVI